MGFTLKSPVLSATLSDERETHARKGLNFERLKMWEMA